MQSLVTFVAKKLIYFNNVEIFFTDQIAYSPDNKS
jgi:hypothetical protein